MDGNKSLKALTSSPFCGPLVDLKTTFIYALKELAPGEYFSRKIRYIGKADDPYARFERHLRSQEKCHRGNWIRSLPAKGLSLQLEILDEVPESEWPFWEREYIRVFRAIGFNLVNETSGGEGGATMAGKTMSQEAREKIRIANTGRVFSLEHRENISRAKVGRKPSAKAIENQRRSQRGVKTKSNSSGIVGVYFHKANKRWIARIQGPGGGSVFLGQFLNKEDAGVARKNAEQKYYA